MKKVKGNAVTALIEKDIDYLLHVANCKGKMGSGIALEIKNRIPQAYNAYKFHEHLNGKVLLGKISSSAGVVNLHAQYNYGYDGKRYLDYEALALCLEQTVDCLKSHPKTKKIGLPMNMGCDRAGGEWKIVEKMIEHYLDGYEVVVYNL